MRSSTFLAVASASSAWCALFSFDNLPANAADFLKAPVAERRQVLPGVSTYVERRQEGNWTVGQSVKTTSGPVTGHAGTTVANVSEYLGIPFAQPPVGDLRFAAPVAFNGTAAINASSFGASCPVAESASSYNITTATLAEANISSSGLEALSYSANPGPWDESCLFLNVWTKPQVGATKKPVMVWIYGGGFTTGSSTVPIYNGASLAEEQDVVVVSLNYRLSIFGFPGNPAGPNNVGLLDQRLAVEWVRDNIAAFGGDPTKITIFGQSAGSASVDFYSYAWASDPIAAGFIAESGNVFGWGLPGSKADGVSAWYEVSELMGCGNSTNSTAAAVQTCMRSKDYQEILNIIPTSLATGGILGLFLPTVDDTVVFSNYTGRKAADVPLLIGNNDYEGGLWRTTFALEGIILSDDFWNAFNLIGFTCPTGVRANASHAQSTPTWRYRYFGEWENLAISTEASSYHGAEIPILFNTQPANSTSEELNFAKYMRGAWATFARDPQKGLNSYGTGWPTYDPAYSTLIRLAYNGSTGTNLASAYDYDWYCVNVNISNVDVASYLTLPNFDPDEPPTGISTQTATGPAGVSATSSLTSTSTGSAPSSSTTKSSGSSRLGMSIGGIIVVALVSISI
ncbi:Alpha/Beta hydrolase protein [Calycina marina]|uniref:Carboxylic ester hydrolase n=1 Tax=Calycina marina TaxID=1763456 RepID=A0A9P7YZA0_9HELO|nr:Alpha/Beta hydrolase protein [Calycina marina]